MQKGNVAAGSPYGEKATDTKSVRKAERHAASIATIKVMSEGQYHMPKMQVKVSELL